MKLINQSAEFLPQEAGLSGIYKAIELAGRTSYLSWDKMTDDSAKKFVDMLIKSKHTSVLEHGTIYLKIPFISGSYGKSWWGETSDHDKLPSPFQEFNIINESSIKASKYYHNQYSNCHIESTYKRCSPIITKRTYVDENKSLSYNESDDYKYNDDGIYFEHIAYITTNLRVLQENGWLDDLQYLCEPTEFHEKRLSVKVITSRSISHELVRHRSMSFIQESQRYVGYNKDKFGGEITYIIPSWLDLKDGKYYKGDYDGFWVWMCDGEYVNTQSENKGGTLFLNLLDNAEQYYKRFCSDEYDLRPQEAREILPNATKTTLVITAFESDWREWFAQRLFGKTGTPHPDMVVLANLIKEEFEKAGVWEGIMKYQSKYE